MLKNTLLILVTISVFYGCKSTKIIKNIDEKITAPFFQNQFTGLYVYDVEEKKEVYNYQGEKYFTPASNTKIFTLFTGLELLGDSIPAFKYAINKDTITIFGTGDPTLFHPYFKDSTAFKMIKNFKKVNLVANTILDKRYGPGWAWEDFDSYFSAERSAFPMYGNVVTVSKQDSLKIAPTYYKNNLNTTDGFYGRDEKKNIFYYGKNRTKETEIPMIMSDSLLVNLWNNIVPNKVSVIKSTTLKPSRIAYSIPKDSLFRRMMEVSDNFLAEQILILASSTLSDTLNSQNARDFMLAHQLKDLKQPPRWVDGSGLSRYNLFSPISFVQVLTKMYDKIPQEELFPFFPIGGKTGTLKSWFVGNPKPYIYAKTGSLGNNYCLSGYLLTKSNKVLIFSFMNNHFKQSNNSIKKQMQDIFEFLRDNY